MPSTFDIDPALAEIAVALMGQHKDDINAALGARYLSLLGFGLLTYDTAITHFDERHLVWKAPNSLSKAAFLLNRYLTPAFMFVGFMGLSGFLGVKLDDDSCRAVFGLVLSFSFVSMAAGNGLVLNRVIALWEDDRRVLLLMTASYVVSYAASLATFVAWLSTQSSNVVQNPLLNMCIIGQTHVLITLAWTTPIFFELMVLGVTWWNAIDRPRQLDQGLAVTLRKDGMHFFIVMTVLRVIQFALMITWNPRLALLGGFIIWPLITLTVNRSLLAMQRAELGDATLLTSPSGRRIPFVIRESKARSKAVGGSIEMNRMVEMEVKFD